jgi:hypothetical protein
MSSRQPGWAAVANVEAAKTAFDKWNTRTHTLTVHELVLARDHAALTRQCGKVIDAINADLRRAVCAQSNWRNA